VKTEIIDISDGAVWPVIDVILQLGLSKSKSEARRMIQQKAIDIKDKDGTIYTAELAGDKSWVHNGSLIKYGKHTFKRVVVKDAPKILAECIELEPGDPGYESD
jgi:tyrosyl-tRNA synthetase